MLHSPHPRRGEREGEREGPWRGFRLYTSRTSSEEKEGREKWSNETRPDGQSGERGAKSLTEAVRNFENSAAAGQEGENR